MEEETLPAQAINSQTSKNNKYFIFGISSLIVILIIVGIFFYFNYDSTNYVLYNNSEYSYSFEYAEDLVIESPNLTIGEAHTGRIKNSNRPYYVFEIMDGNINELPNFEFTKEFFESAYSNKKIISSSEEKINGQKAFKFIYFEGETKMAHIFLLSNKDKSKLIIIHYIFDEQYGKKQLEVLLDTFKEN